MFASPLKGYDALKRTSLAGALALFLLTVTGSGQRSTTQSPKQQQPSAPLQKTTPPASAVPASPSSAGATSSPAAKPGTTTASAPSGGSVIDDDEVIRVTSNLVVVPVSVTDTNGQPVQNLRAADFRLEEEGRAQRVEVGDPDQVPLELALLLDVSGSVRDRFAFEQDAASRFLRDVLKPADRATVYAIDKEPRLLEARATVDVATKKLKVLQPTRDPTAFYDTLVEAARYLDSSTPSRHRRVIIVISDGEDTFSTKFKTAASAIKEIQRADAVLYSINPNGNSLWLNKISQRGQEGMRQLAQATGGVAFVPDMLEDLERIFRQIAAELRSQYLLQYYSDSKAPAGKFLNIKVLVPARPELRIRARQGYYAAGR